MNTNTQIAWLIGILVVTGAALLVFPHAKDCFFTAGQSCECSTNRYLSSCRVVRNPKLIGD